MSAAIPGRHRPGLIETARVSDGCSATVPQFPGVAVPTLLKLDFFLAHLDRALLRIRDQPHFGGDMSDHGDSSRGYAARIEDAEASTVFTPCATGIGRAG